jgi:drug/metabolite transporter (DMT)-like permease
MWFEIAIISYLINACVHVADKFLLSKKMHSSIVYAFYVGIWSVFNAVLLIFSPWIPPDLPTLFLDLSAGILFLATLVFWYKALHQSEATIVVPLVGSLTPIFSLVLGTLFLGETISERQFIIFFILIVGGVLVSIKEPHFSWWKKIWIKIRIHLNPFLGKLSAQYNPDRRIFINSTISAFAFAAYYVLMKYIYLHQPFIGSFVWSRLGTFIGVMMVFLVPAWRDKIMEQEKGGAKIKNIFFFLGVRLAAALAFIMINYAVSLGNVAFVNSLQGVQYLFLFLLVLLLSARFPKIMKEEIGKGVLLQKLIGVGLVSLGLYLLLLK